MYKMDQWNAPQWTDFTSSPQPLCEDYFDYEHKEHEPHLNDCEEFEASSSAIGVLDKSCTGSVPAATPTRSPNKIVTSKIPSKKEDTEDDVHINLKTPVTVMPLVKKHRNSAVANKTTYEDILADAMSNLKLLSSKRKSRRSHNVSIYKPSSSIKLQPRKSMGITPSESYSCKKNIMKELQIIRPAETETVCDIVDESIKQDKTEVENTTKPEKSAITCSFNKGSNVANLRKSVANPTLLTCKYRRYSLSKNRRRSNQYVSLAEAVNKFQNQTPKRFRTGTTKNMEPGPLAKTKQSLKITKPISPVLLSKTRVRTTVFATSDQDIHGKAIPSNEANQKNKCKAKPVNFRTTVFATSDQDIHGKAIPSKEANQKNECKAKPVNFRKTVFATSDQDIHGKAIPPNDANQKNKCKAKPVNLRTSKPPVLQISNISQVTTKKRFNKITMPIIESNLSEASGYGIKNVEMSNFGVRAISTHKKSTSAVPFSFEAREKELRKKRAEKLEKLQAEKENRKAAPTVHAGATNTKLLPKNLHVAPPMLKTDRRAKERREFDQKLKQKECQEDEIRRRLKEEQLAREKADKALLRKMAEPKARPMPVYKPVAILKSNKPLTAPQSPAWAAKAKH